MIAIVGAGPAGSTAAYHLAKAGHKVTLYEEHTQIGKPVQCTGIVTKKLFDVVDYSKDYMINELNGVDIIGPKEAKIHIPLKEYVICRTKFDNHLVNKAMDAGAQVALGHRFVGFENKQPVFIVNGRKKTVNSDIIVGADGPQSKVGKSAGIDVRRDHYFGAQATIKGRFDPHVFKVYFGSLAPQFFSWVVPENGEYARVGVATKQRPYDYFKMLHKIVGGEITEQQGGVIPIYNHKQQVEKGNVFLVGDAGGLSKHTTGGGIITGMHSGKILSECINEKKSYTQELKWLRKELRLHNYLRYVLDKFSDEDYERLLSLMNTAPVKKILYKYDRDYPSKFMLKLLFAQPRFLQFARFAI